MILELGGGRVGQSLRGKGLGDGAGGAFRASGDGGDGVAQNGRTFEGTNGRTNRKT